MKLTGDSCFDAQLGYRIVNMLRVAAVGSQSKTLFESLCMSNVVFYGVLGEMFSFRGPSGRWILSIN